MLTLRRRSLTRVFWVVALAILVRLLFFSDSRTRPNHVQAPEIRRQGVLDLVGARNDRLDVQKHDFLQVRIGRDEREDLFTEVIRDGVDDFWDRFQKPYITDKTTSHIDQQGVMSAIDQLLTLNGWVAALCPTLSRPFGQADNAYDELIRENHLYFVGMVIHSADHFIVDQLAVIVQMARRLGSQNIFVSMLDYDSSDSTETLLDLCEAVLTLLGVPFRIRKVAPMTEDPTAAYYPLEEAHTRNLVLEPLEELRARRAIRFHRVIWLKGFTCPNDIFETIAVSRANSAAMVCGMDWAEHNGFFIFSDRWRTRDINGDQFRQSRSSSAAGAGPPRDAEGAKRYSQHLPFQVFCCESGTHVVDPEQTYYTGLKYRSGMEIANLSTTDPAPRRGADSQCLDSSQMYFCRDLWLSAARDGMREVEAKVGADARGGGGLGLGLNLGWGSKPTEIPAANVERYRKAKRQEPEPEPVPVPEPKPVPVPEQEQESEPEQEEEQDLTKEQALDALRKVAEEERLKQEQRQKGEEGGAGVGGGHAQRQRPAVGDADANVGSDFDAMPDSGDDSVDSHAAQPPLNAGSGSGSGSGLGSGVGGEGGGEGDVDDLGGLAIPNTEFRPARILVNPRCVTTYAGVSHAQLALDLFGPEGEADGEIGEDGSGLGAGGRGPNLREKYVLDDWEGAPESFVCQEQRTTGGRKAPKTQRRLAFSIFGDLEREEAAAAAAVGPFY